MRFATAQVIRAAGIVLLGCMLSLVTPARADGDLSLGAALAQALKTNPNTLLRQQQVIGAEGQVLQAQGAFDPVISASAGRSRDLRPLRADESDSFHAAGLDPGRSQIRQSTSYRVGADRMLMSGLTAGAGFTVTSTDDNLQQVAGVPSQLVGTVSFTLRVPMGRNAGRETAGAELDAAQSELDGFRADLHHGNARLVLDTAMAYWDWVAKTRRLNIATASERRLADLVEEMQRLIGAGQMPRADIELALASRAEKTAQRLAAEQALQESRKVLARLLGLAPGRLHEMIVPSDDFPPYHELDSNVLEADLIRDALSARADLDAGRYRVRAARYRLTAARNNLKPRLDLDLSVGYSGLAEGSSFSRADRSLAMGTGPSLGATVALQWPWENSTAQGTQRAAAAAYDSATIRLGDLRDTIATNVPVAVAAARRAAAQGQEGAQAVARYEITLANEKKKRRLGNATVIDVINVEDRLDNALLVDVGLRQAYANAIAQLRFELGSLIRRDGEVYRIALDGLLRGRMLGD